MPTVKTIRGDKVVDVQVEETTKSMQRLRGRVYPSYEVPGKLEAFQVEQARKAWKEPESGNDGQPVAVQRAATQPEPTFPQSQFFSKSKLVPMESQSKEEVCRIVQESRSDWGCYNT